MDQLNILIVEDHSDINHMIYKHLCANGYACRQAFSGTEALLLLEMQSFDLMILDLMLPGMEGEEVLHRLRKTSDLPVIVLTAKDSLESKVDLLRSGADDYLCKPFAIEELLVRIQVQLRKSNKTIRCHSFKQLTLDPDIYDALINGARLYLTRHEYMIIELLSRNPHRVFTKQEIYEYAWKQDYLGDEKTINVHISNIRRKIAKQSKDIYIKTVWGIGFKMAE